MSALAVTATALALASITPTYADGDSLNPLDNSTYAPASLSDNGPAASQAVAPSISPSQPAVPAVSASQSTPTGPTTLANSDHGLNAAIAVRAGTLGIGIEGSALVSPNVAVRIGYNDYSFSHSATYQNVDYSGKLSLNNEELLANLYPTKKTTFHFTAGVIFNNNQITGNSGGPVTLSGTQYPTGLNAKVKFPSAAPYLGIGFGKPAAKGSALSFLFDIGAVFQGKASVSLNPTDPANVSGSSTFPGDLNTLRNNTQSDLNKYFQIYPVISIGLAYRL